MNRTGACINDFRALPLRKSLMDETCLLYDEREDDAADLQSAR